MEKDSVDKKCPRPAPTGTSCERHADCRAGSQYCAKVVMGVVVEWNGMLVGGDGYRMGVVVMVIMIGWIFFYRAWRAMLCHGIGWDGAVVGW